MIKKAILKIKTALALKKKGQNRISEAYKQAKSIGLIYSFESKENEKAQKEMIQRIEGDGKQVHTITYVDSSKGLTDPDYAFFTDKDLDAKGSWKNPIVEEFKKNPFDFLVSLDGELNKYTQNILAASAAKCRVGKFEEDKSQFFELMINPGELNYSAFLKSMEKKCLPNASQKEE